MNPKSLFVAVALAVAAFPVGAQSPAEGAKAEDYQRAFGIRGHNAALVRNANMRASWIGDTHKFWYVDETPSGRVYTLVDADKRTSRALFDHKALATALAAHTGKTTDAAELRLEHVQPTANADSVAFVVNGHHYVWVASKKPQLIDRGPVAPRPDQPHWMVVDEEKGNYRIPSPDGTKEAFIREYNVWVRDLATGTDRQISHDGTIGNYYSAYIQWSPDGKKLVSNKIRPVEKRYVYYVESSPADQLQPRLHKQEYAKPGDELRFKTPVILNLETGETLLPSTALFDHQYDLYGPEWNSDSEGITFEYNERGHKNYRLLEMSASDGSVRPLVEESHEKYVNYPRIFRQKLADGKRIVWSSERDNYNHLYMYDRATASPVCQITKGDWYVRDVIDVDEESGRIIFTANGVAKDEDPYNIRAYSIAFDGTDMRDLSPAPGTHTVNFSADHKYLVDINSSVTTAPTMRLRSGVDGSELMKVADADISALLADGWQAPEPFAAPGRDGTTMMYGNIYRPSNFDPSKKYPVIEYIYQGPGDHYVPKTFQAANGFMAPMAELGFIVVMVDGLGTSFRSREFENFCYKNLGDAGIPDHIAWIKAAGEKYPYMDLDRVGIFGCSAGGQESTSALLHYPEFYKAAYSACGCHDNRMDKIWWNELWMGYPIDEAYEQSSNVVNAHLLQRPLMLVVGELDDNVDPASTMQVAAALIKVNKDFELVVVPGAHHTMGEAFGDHKRFDFFVRHLQGVNPPSWSEVEKK